MNQPTFINFKELKDKKELFYFSITLIISVLLYLICIATVIGAIYLIFIGICIFFAQGFFYGYVKSNSIKITDTQMEEINAIAEDLSSKLQIKKPNIYILQSGGILNAMASRFWFKDYVIIYSDVLEMAFEQGEDAVKFILAHELAHIKRKHLSKNGILALGRIIPFLGAAYSRACERTCDNYAIVLTPENTADGLTAILAGKMLYKKINITNYLNIANSEQCFWCWLHEICSSHPNLISRIENIIQRKKLIISNEKINNMQLL